MDTTGTPYLPDLPREASSIPANQVMQPVREIGVLSFQSTYKDARDLLLRIPNQEVIPLVQSVSSMVVCGAVMRDDVVRALRKLEHYNQLSYASPVPLGLPTSSSSSKNHQKQQHENVNEENDEEELGKSGMKRREMDVHQVTTLFPSSYHYQDDEVGRPRGTGDAYDS